jgi:hypothetical protein
MSRNQMFPILCLAIAILITALVMSSPRMRINFIDGRYFYLAARMFIDRESPYDLDRFRKQLQTISQQNRHLANGLTVRLDPYAYPPASLVLYAPLGLFDYPLAKRLLTIINVLLMPIAAWMTILLFGKKLRSTPRSEVGMAECLVTGSPRRDRTVVFGISDPLSLSSITQSLAVVALIGGLMHFSFPITITLGQTAIIVLFALIGTMLAIEKRNIVLAAACVAIAAIKPQVTLLPIVAILIRERAWRESVALLFSVAVSNLAAIVVIYHPGLLGEMIDAVIYNRSLDVNRAPNTWGGLFLGTQSSVIAAVNPVLITTGLIAMLLAACYRNNYPKHTAVVASILLTMYAMPLHHYDFVLIVAALLGCLTISPVLGVLMVVLVVGVDREIISLAIISRIPGIREISHQTLHAMYILICFVAIQGYIFLRAFRWRAGLS